MPLLGFFCLRGPSEQFSGVLRLFFSQPQSLHVPWEVFFYLSGGATTVFFLFYLASHTGDSFTLEKLVGSKNYLSWSASVELWFMGQGYEDHLVTQEADIPEVERVQWRKIDAQLCSVLWQSVDPKILLHLRAYKTCFKFWTQAKDYTRMISSVFIRWLLLLSISTNRTWIYLLILARLPLLRRSS